MALATVPVASSARADDAKCIAAFERTQRLRQKGQLREAREEALVCSSPECPQIAARDCTGWVIELDGLVPSVVFSATTNGTRLVDVTVNVDGATWMTKLDGRATPIDPGPHHIRFAASGYLTVEEDVVIAEGEKARQLGVALVSAGAPPAAPPRARPVPTTVWVLAGASVVTLGVGTFFAIDGFRRKGDLEDLHCKPSCNITEVDAMKRSFLIGDVVFGVSLVAAATAVVLFVRRPSQATAAAYDPAMPLRLRF